jgi:predicted dehydrogenase
MSCIQWVDILNNENAMDATRIGLIGFGGLAQHVHAPVLQGLGAARVVAVADAEAGRRELARAHFPQAAICEDFTQLLDMAEVEAVVIALPTRFHVPAALEAVRRGKHFYLEKPLAPSAAEAGPLIDAWRGSGLVGMMGFNQRFHPLHRALRQSIQGGRIGTPLGARTAFCTPARPLAAWRSRRAEGGGALMELGCHHIDLVAWLFGSPIRQVRASIRSVVSESDAAWLHLTLANGMEIQSFFSLSALDQDQWEIDGSKGSAALDRYRSTMPRFTPAGQEFSLKTRLDHLIAPLRGVGYALHRRRSVAREPSFVPAMEAFLAAVRGGPMEGAGLLDGLWVSQVIEAAERSAASGRVEVVETVEVASAQTALAEGPLPSPCPENRGSEENAPQLSVILSTPDTYAGLRRTVAALGRQTVAGCIELLIVAPDAQKLEMIPEELKPFARWEVVEMGAARAFGHAESNAAAIRRATAPVVALGEDHAFPHPKWAQSLLARHRESAYAAVGPVVANANPGTLTSWADLFIGYGPWLEPQSGGCVDFLPGHNSSYRRDVLLQYGPRLEEMMRAETVLHWDLRAKGHRLYLEPRARLSHTNFGMPGVWLKVQYHAGRTFAAARAGQWRWTRRIAFALGSPLIPLVRLGRVVRRARPSNAPSMLRLLPVLGMGLVMDGVGQMIGYLFGAGRSGQILATYEFHRWRFVGPEDKKMTRVEESSEPANAVLHDLPCGAPAEAAQPELSVIVATPDTFATLQKTVRHLQAQTAASKIELLIIAPSFAALQPDPAQLGGFAAVRVVEVGPMRTPAPGKVAAVGCAAASVVAFGEDHCYPEPQWAAALIEAHRGPWAAVGPVVLNANPATLRSWTNYIPCFGRWCEPLEAGATDQTAWHNTSYKRDILLEYGERLAAFLTVEGTLFEDLRARGHQIYLEPAARVHHVNISRARSVFLQAFHGGRIYGALRAGNGNWSWRRRLLYIGGAPLIPPLRLRREISTIGRIGRGGLLLPRILPLLAAQLVAHAAGEALGYIAGAGGAERHYGDYEMYRRRHLARVDQRAELDF